MNIFMAEHEKEWSRNYFESAELMLLKKYLYNSRKKCDKAKYTYVSNANSKTEKEF